MKEVATQWNLVMYHLEKAMNAWARYGEEWQKVSYESLPVKMQQWAAGLHPCTPYAHVIPILHSAVMTRGGYEAQKIEIPKEEKGENSGKERTSKD